MTISSTTVKNSYSGNGTLDTFNYTFKVFADADLQVIIRDASATETVKTLTTHYTVTGAGSASGGTVVFTAGNIPTATETVVIRRASPQTQAIDYIANDPFPAESHEEGLDRSMMAIQQLQEEIDRSIKLSRTNTMTSTEFTVGDTDRANKVFGFDASGELTVAQELGTFKGNWSSGTTYAVRDIIKDTSTNNIFIALTAHTSSGSQPLTTNTDSAKWGLLVDAAAATTSATNAANSATAAAASAVNATNNGAAQVTLATAQVALATTQATNSANSATASATSETNSANSATASANSATSSASSATASANSATASANSASAAAATFDLFDDAFLGAKSSNPSVDNDGNALQDGALYFDTTNDVMKVYNLASTTWLQLTPTVTNQNNINSAVANASNINAAVANESNINAAVSNASNINSVVSNASNINSVAGIASNITSVANNETNINSVNSNSANINLTAGSIANVNNVGNSIASVNTAASNLTSINSFANTYLGASSSAPTQDPDGSSLDLGDLYFDTGSNQLKVYSSTGWVNAGSSVNGTSDRFKYTVSGTPTTISGNDDNSKSLSYDAGFIDVFLNGIKMVNGTDVTVTSGNSVVFASALTNGDVVDIITFGTFNIATLGNTSVTGGLSFPDNVKAKFGTGNDLEIYHDGSNSNISDVGTGQLVLRTDGAQVIINKGSSENMARFITDGAVELYHNNIKKFETTSGGATVTGKFNVSSNIADFAIKSENTTHNARVDIIASGSNKNSILNFGDGASSTVGYIDYDHADNSLRFATSATERARIDASGNVLVGKTSTSRPVAGAEFRSTGFARFTRDQGNPLEVTRTTNDGEAIKFYKDNTHVGSIGTGSGYIHIGIGDTGIGFASDDIIPYNLDTNAVRDNSIDLGSSSYRFKDLYLGGGLYVGGTGSANKLDDYEEGTWTPGFTGTGGAPSGVNYTSRLGWYTKVGQLVHVTLFLALSSLTTSPTGTLRISGLPFTALNSTGYRNVASVGYSQNFPTTDAPSAGYLVQNSSEIRLVVRNSSDARENMNSLVNGSSLGGNEQLFLSATYQTD